MLLPFKWAPGISLGRGCAPWAFWSPTALAAKIHISSRFFVAKIYLPLQIALYLLEIDPYDKKSLTPYYSECIKLSESVDRLQIGLMDLTLRPHVKTLHLIDLSRGIAVIPPIPPLLFPLFFFFNFYLAKIESYRWGLKFYHTKSNKPVQNPINSKEVF